MATKEEILALADELAADGQQPTQNAIRKRLGGSFSTIGPILQEWRASREESSQLAAIEVPDEVTTALTEVGARVWRAARRQAELGHDEMRRALAAANARAEQADEEHAEAIGVIEQERDEAQARADAADARARTAEAEIEQLRRNVQEAEAARADAAAAKAAAEATANGLREHLADMRQTVERLTARQGDAA
jgi:chromosome segregation ATPase